MADQEGVVTGSPDIHKGVNRGKRAREEKTSGKMGTLNPCGGKWKLKTEEDIGKGPTGDTVLC